MKLGVAVLRAAVGILFMGHGLQKLAGWFGGPGVAATGEHFETLGLRPGKRHAVAAGAAETAGGALLAGGFLTPLAASMLSGSMLTAIRKVHAKNGIWVTEGGFEYNLVLLAAVFAISDVGPGELSLDEALGLRLRGPVWALAQLALAAAGSAYAVATGERQPPQKERASGGAPQARGASVGSEREHVGAGATSSASA
jgi:putative oxidoreductase